jgi:hypothetical protein
MTKKFMRLLQISKLTWFFYCHHSSVAKMVPSSVYQPTPVSIINFFHTLQSFLIPSYLFFSRDFDNESLVWSLNDCMTNFQLALSKCVFGLMPLSIAVIQMLQNVCNIAWLQEALSCVSNLSISYGWQCNEKLNKQLTIWTRDWMLIRPKIR